jgi:hypothetical protein
MRPLRVTRPTLASCRSQSTPPSDATDALAWPRRLRHLGLARCYQYSREMVQWLRMYVHEVQLDATRDAPFS